jgi:hypothetical protein
MHPLKRLNEIEKVNTMTLQNLSRRDISLLISSIIVSHNKELSKVHVVDKAVDLIWVNPSTYHTSNYYLLDSHHHHHIYI